MQQTMQVVHAERTITIYTDMLTYPAGATDHHVKEFVATVVPNSKNVSQIRGGQQGALEFLARLKAQIDAGML